MYTVQCTVSYNVLYCRAPASCPLIVSYREHCQQSAPVRGSWAREARWWWQQRWARTRARPVRPPHYTSGTRRLQRHRRPPRGWAHPRSFARSWRSWSAARSRWAPRGSAGRQAGRDRAGGRSLSARYATDACGCPAWGRNRAAHIRTSMKCNCVVKNEDIKVEKLLDKYVTVIPDGNLDSPHLECKVVSQWGYVLEDRHIRVWARAAEYSRSRRTRGRGERYC